MPYPLPAITIPPWPKSQSSSKKSTKTSNSNTPAFASRKPATPSTVIGPKAGETYVGKHGYPQKSEKAATDVKASDYALIVIPGGTSPRSHAPQTEAWSSSSATPPPEKSPWPPSATAPGCSARPTPSRGRRCTSYMSIVHDVVNAGGKWVDEECVVDGPIITARCPDDLPAFSNAILQLVSGEKPTGVKGKPIAPAGSWRPFPPHRTADYF